MKTFWPKNGCVDLFIIFIGIKKGTPHLIWKSHNIKKNNFMAPFYV